MIEPVLRTAPQTWRRNLPILQQLERKLLWLSAWTIHNANHHRPNRDGLKVGGHQASSASVASIMTALYFSVLRPEDRVAVKPHASPIFHAIQYLLGNQTLERLQNFRALGGAQSYPSRTKDADDVDFSTGSVGLGVAMTAFAGLVQDYVELKGWLPKDLGAGRMIAIVGDAELDEGNIHEALIESWKQDIRNCWWIIDYNRQSLDAVVSDRLFLGIESQFKAVGWRVVTLKYGKKLEAAFARADGESLRRWIDDCPNSLYSALVFKGGRGWREHLTRDLGELQGIRWLLDEHDDDALAALMTNLAGHDLEALLEAFHGIPDDHRTCFVVYTIKGFGLPFAGHKDNHAGLMNPDQMAEFRRQHRIGDGAEWGKYEGLTLTPPALDEFLAAVPFAAKGTRRCISPIVDLPELLPLAITPRMSTQEGFGRVLADLARIGGPLAERIVTTSPDVAVSTNLGGWVNRRGVFNRHRREDVFSEQKVVSAQRWQMTPAGQHIELGIAENNLFILLAALGLSHSLFGARLLPIGTVYDPFIQRGLDALNYACYQDARFMLVATPSGLALAPEGGAHQSVGTPLIGLAQDGLAAFEPAFVDELAAILRWSFDYMQRDGSGESDPGEWLRDIKGGSVYLRLSTRTLAQPERNLDGGLREQIIAGGYWLKPPAAGSRLAIVAMGAVMPEALEAHAQLSDEMPGAGLLAVTSADRLNAGWHAVERARQSGHRDAQCHLEKLLTLLAPDAGLVTILDGHPAALSWVGGVRGHRVRPLGVEHFGQSGDIPDLFERYRIDAAAILDACAAVCLRS
jgi:pyruvate dehydrogenase E1 component